MRVSKGSIVELVGKHVHASIEVGAIEDLYAVEAKYVDLPLYIEVNNLCVTHRAKGIAQCAHLIKRCCHDGSSKNGINVLSREQVTHDYVRSYDDDDVYWH
jgi:hypothetical protein